MTTRNVVRIIMILIIAVLAWINEDGVEEKTSPVITHEAAISTSITVASESAHVARVVDGDTVELSDGRRVRYIGIDTPELGASRTSLVCFGKEATEANNALVGGKDVWMKKDVSDVDRYGRLLRYIYVGDIFVNEQLVKNGYAKVATFPPDVSHQSVFIQAEQYAREQSIGLWSSCK